MIHPQDLSDFQVMSGNKPLPPGFEQEYEKWLRMQHRRKQSGPLGSLMVPLCRQFGVEPPDNVITDGRSVDWRNVARGHRVLVVIKDGEASRTVGGAFRGTGAHGEVSVVVDGDTWVREYRPYQVSLDLEIPPDVKLPERVVEQIEAASDTWEFSQVDDSGDTAVATVSRPAIKNSRFLSLGAGARLSIEINDDYQDALFVAIGPNDGEITVTTEGEPDPIAVPEEQVDIA
jgi:hypothetical protein